MNENKTAEEMVEYIKCCRTGGALSKPEHMNPQDAETIKELIALSDSIQPDPEFVLALQTRLTFETISGPTGHGLPSSYQGTNTIDSTLDQETGSMPRAAVKKGISAWLGLMGHAISTRREAVVLLSLVLLILVLFRYLIYDTELVSAQEVLEAANEVFVPEVFPGDVVYTRFAVRIRNGFDRTQYVFNFDEYIAETWVSVSGDLVRYQLTDSQGDYYYFVQRSGDAVRRGSSGSAIGKDAIDTLVQIPFNEFLRGLSSGRHPDALPSYLTSGDVLPGIFNFNSLVAEEKEMCLSLSCLLELIDSNRANIALNLREMTEDGRDLYIIEVSNSPPSMAGYLSEGPRAWVKIDVQSNNLVALVAGYFGNVLPFDEYSSAVLEERVVIHEVDVDLSLFSKAPDGIGVIDWQLLGVQTDEIKDDVWIKSTIPESGTRIGHEELLWFEITFGYRLLTAPDAIASVYLGRVDAQQIFEEWSGRCYIGIPGAWVSAGVPLRTKIASGVGEFTAKFRVWQDDLFKMGPTTITPTVIFHENVGSVTSNTLYYEVLDQYTWEVDVPPISDRECPTYP